MEMSWPQMLIKSSGQRIYDLPVACMPVDWKQDGLEVRNNEKKLRTASASTCVDAGVARNN